MIEMVQPCGGPTMLGIETGITFQFKALACSWFSLPGTNAAALICVRADQRRHQGRGGALKIGQSNREELPRQKNGPARLWSSSVWAVDLPGLSQYRTSSADERNDHCWASWPAWPITSSVEGGCPDLDPFRGSGCGAKLTCNRLVRLAKTVRLPAPLIAAVRCHSPS